MRPTVRVTAAARLHFGMFSFGHAAQEPFGGVGAMIDEPRTQLVVAAAERFHVQGLRSDRAERFARQAVDAWSLPELPRCAIQIESTSEEHTGLGSGTQLGLSVAAGLHAFLDRPAADCAQLAEAVGRGRRSAVGTYGFAHGGMIVEAGKEADGAISKLATRTPLPPAWRFVLLRPPSGQGLYGVSEDEAFELLPPVPAMTSETLRRIAVNELVPAAREGAFDRFAAKLYEYGVTAGECFARITGGPFSSPQAERIVEQVRTMGVQGVGQSSWGPTLFALLPDNAAAVRFVDQLRRHPELQVIRWTITAPCNAGAGIEKSYAG